MCDSKQSDFKQLMSKAYSPCPEILVIYSCFCAALFVSFNISRQFFSISSLQVRKASSSRLIELAKSGLVRITTIS